VKLKDISVLGLVALVTITPWISPLLRAQVRSQGQQNPSGASGSGDQRIRSFRGRHRDNREESVESKAQLTPAQAQQILQTKNYYASLTPRQSYVEGRGYLNFIFPKDSPGGEIDGRSGTAHLMDYADVVEIGIRARATEKPYLVDCSVKGTGPCYECFFSIQGPDAQTETWQMTSDWMHLQFTVTPGDTDWYPLKLQARHDYTLKSCEVMEVP